MTKEEEIWKTNCSKVEEKVLRRRYFPKTIKNCRNIDDGDSSKAPIKKKGRLVGSKNNKKTTDE